MTGQRVGPYALVRRSGELCSGRSPGGRGIVEIMRDEVTSRAAVVRPVGRI